MSAPHPRPPRRIAVPHDARGLSRREFLRRVGAGIVMLLPASWPGAHAQSPQRLYPEDFNAYLSIGRDGRVTVYSGKIEMGQDVVTSQAQLVAEELGVALERIEMVLGDTDRCPWDMGTFGSLTIRMFGPALRAAAAQARATLLDLAAARLGVGTGELQASGGVVRVRAASERAVSYGELARGARIAHVVDAKAALKAATEMSVMGRSPARLDALEKVTGAAKFTADLRLPGMMCARLLRPPVHGARLLEVDVSAAQALPGVRVVREDDLVAVLHRDPQAAADALARVRARWSAPSSPLDADNVHEHLRGVLVDAKTIAEQGDVTAARAASPRRFAAAMRKGYVAHAPIETHAALAQWRDGKLTVWASTQTPFPTRDAIAARLRLDRAAVRVITPWVGGGFGGKSESAQAIEAARLAVATGAPVQVARTREEEFFFDTFDPACVVTIDAGLDAAGRIAYWDYAVYAAGERGAAPIYDLAHQRIRAYGRSAYEIDPSAPSVHPFAVGPWRAPGANMNVYARESQIDVLAQAAGVDPVAFRLAHLGDERMRRVLRTAAASFGWQPAAGPSGRGVGVAIATDAGSCVAACAEVTVDRTSGRVSVRRITCAQDMGLVVNPDGARRQIEGALTMGLGYALGEELRFRGGDILDRNFDRYRLPRFSDVPRIDAVLVPNDTLAPQGGGEPAITVTGAVLANAVYDAIGVPQRRLPMTPERVLGSLAAR